MEGQQLGSCSGGGGMVGRKRVHYLKGRAVVHCNKW
jgi:hypothetical protein